MEAFSLKIIGNSKNSHAVEKNELLYELFKHAREQLQEILNHALLKIWEEEELPAALPVRRSNLFPLVQFNRLRPLDESFVSKYQTVIHVADNRWIK